MYSQEDFHRQVLGSEWVESDGGGILTATKMYAPSDYKADGTLKKKARLRRMWVLWDNAPPLKMRDSPLLQRICMEHNLFINRENPERQEQLLRGEIRWLTRHLADMVKPRVGAEKSAEEK